METIRSVRRPVRDLRPGDHAWSVFAGEDEQCHVTGAFIRDGLLAGEKVIYLAETPRVGIPAAPYASDIPIVSSVPVILAIGADTDVGAALGKEIARAEDLGFRAIRIVADLTWALRRPGGLDLVLDLERHVERAVRHGAAVTAVCQLDRRRCRPTELDAFRAVHGPRATPDPVFEDDVLKIEHTFRPPGLALSGELDASRHTVLDRALSSAVSSSGRREIHLDLAGLGFIDLGALNMLAEVAGRRARCGPLVLDRMSPQLRAVMETVGWNMLPGLRVSIA